MIYPLRGYVFSICINYEQQGHDMNLKNVSIQFNFIFFILSNIYFCSSSMHWSCERLWLNMICTIFKSFITSVEYCISSKIPTASSFILINSCNLVSKYAFLLAGGLNCLMLDSYYNNIILVKVFTISKIILFEVKYSETSITRIGWGEKKNSSFRKFEL